MMKWHQTNFTQCHDRASTVSRPSLRCLRLLVPPSTGYAEEENTAAEGKLQRHGHPDAYEPIILTQRIGERQAYAPHRGEVHHCRFERITGTEAHTERHNAGGKEGLGKSLDAQHADTQLADG